MWPHTTVQLYQERDFQDDSMHFHHARPSLSSA